MPPRVEYSHAGWQSGDHSDASNERKVDMIGKTMKAFLFLLLAIPCGAVELSVTIGRVGLKPGETQTITVACTNGAPVEWAGTLKVAVAHDVAERISIATDSVTLAPGEARAFAFTWTPKVAYWGCSAEAELFVEGKASSRSRYAFTVSENLPMASPAMGTSHSTGTLTPEAVAARVREFADCGVPVIEAFSWSPNLWGGTVCPETNEWIAGQGGFRESAASINALTGKAHELGMLVYTYAQPSFRGAAGERWAREHPEDVLYRTPEAQLESPSPTGKFAAYANPFNQKALDTGLDSYAKAMRAFNFDGIRWDGHPGVFYHPLSDWVSRCNGGVSSFPYDSEGRAILPDQPDVSNAKLVEYSHQRLNAQVPGLLWGYNLTMGPSETGGYNITFPTMFRKLASDNLLLQERHFHAGRDGRPYIHVNQRWSTISEDLAYSSELMHVLGGYLYRGDFGFAPSEAFAKHAFALHYASRSRTFGVCPWYRPSGGDFPYDFVRFALRYGKFLFHPSLNRFNPQAPLQRVSVTTQAPFPVKFENHCYDLCVDKKFRTIIHLLNSPVTDQVNTQTTVEPPWVAEKTVVGIRHPLGLDKASARYTVLSPEWEQAAIDVTPDNTRAVTNIEVPAFRYWAMVVCEYEIGSGQVEHSSAGELFLPVLHRPGEL